MAEHGVVTAPGTVRFERVLPGPIERVWAYLTEPEKRARWLAGGPMELVPGGEVRIEFHNSTLSGTPEPVPERWRDAEGHVMRGRILRCEPPFLLSYSWGEASGVPSEVSFELTPQQDEVRLVLVHRRLAGRQLMVNVGSGWHAHLEVLAAELANRQRPRFWAMHAGLEAEYAARLPAA